MVFTFYVSPHPADVISEQPLSGWTVVINLNYTFHHLFVVTFNIIFTMMMKIILLVHVRVWQEEALWRPNGELIYKPLEREPPISSSSKIYRFKYIY